MKWYIKDGKIGGQESDGTILFEVDDHAAEITIPDGVTPIGPCAFAECVGLASIVIPDSVTEIGELAFTNCRKLQKVIISGDTEVGKDAFIGCKSLHG